MRDQEKVRAARRRWYQKNKEKAKDAVYRRREELWKWFKEYKLGLACIQCGENHPATLDFHHRDPDNKEATINRMLTNGRSKKAILQEIEKCDVLCANCHRIFHFDEQND
jgi:hypothetical protein